MIQLVVNHLWQSTLFAGAVALLTLLLRGNSARLRYALWLSASLKFLVPFALLTALGAHIPWRSVVAAPPPLVVLMDRIVEPLATPGPTVREAESPAIWLVKAKIVRIFGLVWACGALAVLVTWIRRWSVIQRALKASRPTDIPLPIAVRSSTTLLEPGIVGVLRPVLLVPEGIEARLAADQLRAVLAHELCHVRRRDNLTATFHMVVEMFVWFYPLIWWLGARLIAERERACDEEVLRSGNKPQVYAEGILRVCQHYLTSPLICSAGVSGANLKWRIEVIMENKSTSRLSGTKKVILAAAAAVSVVVPILSGFSTSAARAQSSIEGPPLKKEWVTNFFFPVGRTPEHINGVMHAKFEAEPIADPNWSANVEADATHYFALQASAQIVDVVSMACHTTICEILVVGKSAETVSQAFDQWQHTIFAGHKESWSIQNGLIDQTTALSKTDDGRMIAVTYLTTKRIKFHPATLEY